MDFHVCIKQVPDVTAPMHTGRTVLNAYDASSVEECLVLREKVGGTINLVLIGPTDAGEAIRKALAMGADAATHYVVESMDGLDSSVFAHILADHFRSVSFDVIACGKQAQDTDAGLTGAMLAEMLDVPYASNAVGLEADGSQLVVTRQGDGGHEIIALPVPCLVTCSNDMNDPRIPSLKGIMAAKKKPVETKQLDTVPAAATAVVGYEPVPARQRGEYVEGDTPEEMVSALVERLHNVSKVV